MSTQRRTSTSSTGGATPGHDDEYPTDTFDSVGGTEEGLEDGGWDQLVGSTSPAEEGDERPTQVFSAIRDEQPERTTVAEQLFGGSAVPEEDDTAVFARYRDTDPDPRATAGTPAVHPAARDDAHTEQFAAYRDEAYEDPHQTRGAGSTSWSGPAVPVPGSTTSPVSPIPAGGKRALREQPALDEHVAAQALEQQGAVGEAGAESEALSRPEGQESEPGDQPAAEPALDKKTAKRLAKEQQQAAKDAAKAEKAAAEQAAKAEKAAAQQAAKAERLAAKAAKKVGRGRGAKGGWTAQNGSVAEYTSAVEAAAEAAAAAPAEAGANARAVATAFGDGGTDGAQAGTAQPDGAQAGTAQPDGAQLEGAEPGSAQLEGAEPGSAAVTAAPAVPRRKAPVLVVLLLLFIAVASSAAAWLFHQQAATASKQRPSSNIALLDKSATADAVAQVSKAVEAIYSYDSASLDQSESLALSQITGSYVSEFKDNFAAVRALPAQQRASLTSKVAAAGVITLTERRANLLVMLDQAGRRGDNAEPVRSAVRLSVTAQRVDGQWKVSDISQK